MRRYTYRMTIAYDGSPFAGYQRQPAMPSVEQAIRSALDATGIDYRNLSCAGRTDRGVHALGQVLSFYTHIPIDRQRIIEAVDAAAPDHIVCRELREAPRWFHARFSAVARSYIYFAPDCDDVDATIVDDLLQGLRGRRCFSAFARGTPPGRSTIRSLFEAQARRQSCGAIRFDFRANGFLRRQVRVMVATTLREARAGSRDDTLALIAASADRRRTAKAASPSGLYLSQIDYAAP